MRKRKPVDRKRVPSMNLSHGRTLAVRRGPSDVDEVLVRSPSGDIELSIAIGPNGPRLRLRAVDIELVAEGRLSMQCAELDLQVQGPGTIRAGGALELQGEDVHIAAAAGEIAIQANDDIKLQGERIQLNCDEQPMPVSWEEFEARTMAPRTN